MSETQLRKCNKSDFLYKYNLKEGFTMKKEYIRYQPNRSVSFLLLPLICMLMFFSFLLGAYLIKFQDNPKNIIFLTIMLLLDFYSIVKCYYLQSLLFVFCDEGFYVQQGNKGCFWGWDELQYAYYTKDFKAHFYYILSAEPLSKSKIKKQMYKSSAFNKETVVMYLCPLQDCSNISNLIDKKYNVEKHDA